MLCPAPAASSVASKPQQSNKWSSTTPAELVQPIQWYVMDTPDTAGLHSPIHLSQPSPSFPGCRWTPSTVGGLSRSSQGWGGDTQGQQGLGVVSVPGLDSTAERHCCSILLCPCSVPAPFCSALLLPCSILVHHGCLSQWSKLLGGWQMKWPEGGLDVGLAAGTAGSSPEEEVSSHWGQGWCPEPALDGKEHLSTPAKPNWKQTVWFMALWLCMKVLVSCKQMYSEAVLGVTKPNTQNTQKKAKFIIPLAPPCLLLRRGITGYWKIQTKMLKPLDQQLLFFNWLCWLSWFCVVRGAPYLTHRVAGQRKSETSFLLN